MEVFNHTIEFDNWESSLNKLRLPALVTVANNIFVRVQSITNKCVGYPVRHSQSSPFLAVVKAVNSSHPTVNALTTTHQSVQTVWIRRALQSFQHVDCESCRRRILSSGQLLFNHGCSAATERKPNILINSSTFADTMYGEVWRHHGECWHFIAKYKFNGPASTSRAFLPIKFSG